MKDQSVCLPVEWKDWEIIRTIGGGSYGSVYEIHRNIYGYIEKAALKVISIPKSINEIEELKNDGYDQESITAHFQECLESIVKEYTLVREMKGCTNIVHCDDLKCIQHDDGFGWDIYIKMELLVALTEYLPEDIADEQVIQLGLDICNALVQCKERRIVHRDIKPQNICVSEEGCFKLGDFGVAKIIEKTTSATKIGTYNYMAPEVYKGNPYGCNADLYSLGMVMFWLLNDRRLPFLPLPPQTVLPSMAEEARLRRFSGEALPQPRRGNEALKAIVLKACAYNPEERFSTPEDMINALNMLDPTTGVFSSKAEKERLRREQQRLLERQREEERQRESERLRELERQKELEQQKAEEHKKEIQRQKDEELKKLKKRWMMIGCATLSFSTVIVLCILLKKPVEEPKEGTVHIHSWDNISCVVMECSTCGEMRENPDGHSWSEATCTRAKKCSACGEKSGEPLGHQWIGATYSSPKMCSICNITEGSPLESPLSDAIRYCLPLVTYAMCSEERIFGYEDAELTQKSDAYYFKPDTDELVITDISEDGLALKVRYPSSLTESGYRSLWFPVNEIIPLLEMEVGEEEANTTTTTYRYSQSNDTVVHYGTMEGGNKYVVLGTHESGCRAIIYSIYRKSKYGMDVRYKMALIK